MGMGEKTGTKHVRYESGLGDDEDQDKSMEEMKTKTMKRMGKKTKKACQEKLGPWVLRMNDKNENGTKLGWE